MGVGYGGYQHALLTAYSSYLPANRSGANLDTLSHAALVTVMAEQGVVGTLLFLAFLAALAVESLRGRRRGGTWAVWVTIPATLVLPIFAYSQIEGRLISEPYFWLSVGLLYSALMRQAAAVESERPWTWVRIVEDPASPRVA
jgi:O-antigen ligase